MLVESWLRSGAFDHPPPPGCQSVTLVLGGRLRPGKRGAGSNALQAGDIRWSSWRSTQVHVAEASAGSAVQLIRLWAGSDHQAGACPEPFCHDTPRSAIPVRRELGAQVHVLCGSSGGVKAAAMVPGNLTFVELRLEPGVEIVQELNAAQRGLLYVLGGTGYIGQLAARVTPGRSVVLSAVAPEERANELSIVAGRKGLYAVFAAAPDVGGL